MPPHVIPPEPSPSSKPSSTRSSASPSEAWVDPLSLVRRLTEAVERLDSKFDELILSIKLLVGGARP